MRDRGVVEEHSKPSPDLNNWLLAHAEDREDLRMFEEGVSSPTPLHAAWSAAASSLQMRHALPEVTHPLSIMSS